MASPTVYATLAALRRYEKLQAAVRVHLAPTCPFVAGREMVVVDTKTMHTTRCLYCFG